MRDKQDGSAEPILALLRRGEEWTTNKELADAIGFVSARGNKSVVGHWKENIDDLFPENETKLVQPGSDRFGSRREVRVFSKAGVIRAALRARTANARAFQDWIIGRAIEKEVWDG